mmetsp:Transcript_31687/g.78961  ORF Transcript_31687/g.78961 Transcript_31687/m.78961 type:complete len:220 (-) Transcript_31687:145-804(-)
MNMRARVIKMTSLMMSSFSRLPTAEGGASFAFSPSSSDSTFLLKHFCNTLTTRITRKRRMIRPRRERSKGPSDAVEPTWHPIMMGKMELNIEPVPAMSIHQKKLHAYGGSRYVRTHCSIEKMPMKMNEIQANGMSTPFEPLITYTTSSANRAQKVAKAKNIRKAGWSRTSSAFLRNAASARARRFSASELSSFSSTTSSCFASQMSSAQAMKRGAATCP